MSPLGASIISGKVSSLLEPVSPINKFKLTLDCSSFHTLSTYCVLEPAQGVRNTAVNKRDLI